MSSSHPAAPSHLAPIPNPAIVQPDVAEQMAAVQEERWKRNELQRCLSSTRGFRSQSLLKAAMVQ